MNRRIRRPLLIESLEGRVALSGGLAPLTSGHARSNHAHVEVHKPHKAEHVANHHTATATATAATTATTSHANDDPANHEQANHDQAGHHGGKDDASGHK